MKIGDEVCVHGYIDEIRPNTIIIRNVGGYFGTEPSEVTIRKVGKWIEKDKGCGDTYYECSYCGEEFVLIEGTPHDNLYYYCPCCGAFME